SALASRATAVAAVVAAAVAIAARPWACFNPLSRYLVVLAKSVGRRPPARTASRRNCGVLPFGATALSAHAPAPTSSIPRSTKYLTRVMGSTHTSRTVFGQAQPQTLDCPVTSRNNFSDARRLTLIGRA